MLQNGQTHFKKSHIFKIYYQMEDHLLYDFESMSDHFGILGVKGLRIFLKTFHGICCYVLLFQLVT